MDRTDVHSHLKAKQPMWSAPLTSEDIDTTYVPRDISSVILIAYIEEPKSSHFSRMSIALHLISAL